MVTFSKCNVIGLKLKHRLIDCVVITRIFLLKFNEWMIAALILVALVFYSWVTIVITLWRKQFRKNQNKVNTALISLGKVRLHLKLET